VTLGGADVLYSLATMTQACGCFTPPQAMPVMALHVAHTCIRCDDRIGFGTTYMQSLTFDALLLRQPEFC